jgi:hypothetical protein
MENNVSHDSAALLETLKKLTFSHPLKGEMSFESLFRAHSGFVCFIPELDQTMCGRLIEEKKELDSLGLQIIIVTKTPCEEREILVIERPSFFGDSGDDKFLFIEEGWKKAFFVPALSDFLKIAVDHIELDSQSIRHLSMKIKTILAEKEIPLPAESGGCSCCKKCH